MSTHHPVKAGPESKPGPTAGKPPASPRPKKPAKPTGPGALKGSPEARRQAALILEVLCGVRTATDASKAMGIALPRYYVLETRALQGFILALEPLPRGTSVRRSGPKCAARRAKAGVAITRSPSALGARTTTLRESRSSRTIDAIIAEGRPCASSGTISTTW